MNFSKIKNILLLCVLSFVMSGCDEDLDPNKWVENSTRMKSNARNQIGSTPYRETQHQVFKNYFSELGKMVLYLKNSKATTEDFNKMFEEGDFQKICSNIFINKSEWNVIVANCTKNRFFLCAEEVRAYPEIVAGLRKALTSDLKNKFDKIASCRDAR